MNYANKEELLRKLAEKIIRNTEEIGDNLAEYPEVSDGKYFADKDKGLGLYHIFNWTQSFYTGLAYWAYRVSGKDMLLKWLYSYYDQYYDKVFTNPMDTMHDLGFLYTPYAVALYKLTGDPNMKALGLKAADELAKRYIPAGRFISAWGRMDGTIPDYVSEELRENVFFNPENRGRVIVDCMMNLPLLFWAWETTGHPYYKDIAESHIQTVLNNFIREDDSLCHAFVFNPDNGEIVTESNSCGFANGSHWARGTGWAVYGFAIAYSYTGNKRYLDTSIRLFEKFISECGDKIPVWDFRLPETEEPNLDTSASAVMLCAALTILEHTEHEGIRKFMDVQEALLMDYIDLSEDNNGLLKEQNGRKVYTSYGDYYLVEYLCMKYCDMKRIW